MAKINLATQQSFFGRIITLQLNLEYILISSVDRTTKLHLSNEVQFLCFCLDSGEDVQIYAMNVFKIREIIFYDGELTQTVGENSGVMLGFLTVREESIPLVDLRRWSYYNPDEPEKDLRDYSIDSGKNLVVVCNFSNYTVGIKICSVKKIIQRNWEEVVPSSQYGFGQDSKIVATTKFDDGSVVQIMDVEKMVIDAFPIFAKYNSMELQSIGNIETDKMVLLAEDSKTAARTLEMVIEKLEIKYITFPSGKELLRYIFDGNNAESVGAIITDLEMPNVSGFEILKRVKDNKETKHIPVIVNSSMSSDSNKQMASTLRADGFITKSNPIEIEEILQRVLH